jgi:Flp pilus assembly protein TadD
MLSPNTAEFHGKLGAVRLEQGRTDEAIAALRRGVELDGNNASIRFQLASALRKAGLQDEARSDFLLAGELMKAKLDFEQAGLATMNGIRQLRAGKPSEAAAALRAAVERKPDYPEANYYLGIALAQMGADSEAVRAFERALQRRPQSAEIHYNFGIALWQMGRAQEATREFRRTATLDPQHGLAHCALGKALARAGQAAEADRALVRARELGACP